MKKLLIIGAGGHARPIIEIAQLRNFVIEGIIDLNYQGNKESILGIPVIGGKDKLDSLDPLDFHIAFALGDNSQRQHQMQKLVQKGHSDFPSLIHPSSIVSDSAVIGEAVVICAGAIINPLVKIGVGSIINTGAIVDHECQIAEFVHIAPGSKLAGRVEVGEKTFVGIGTTIIDKIVIGNEVTIGAGSTIIKPIPSNSKVVGISKFMD